MSREPGAGSDVFPTVLQIEDGIGAETVFPHVCGYRRCADLRSNRARASAGLTVSPRSREASRWLSSGLNSAN